MQDWLLPKETKFPQHYQIPGDAPLSNSIIIHPKVTGVDKILHRVVLRLV